MAREVSANGYSDAYGPNVAQILSSGTRTINGKVPARVRADLRAAVKDGVLGHMAKDGLKPEVFYHPRHRASAVRVRETAAAYSLLCIEKVVGANTDLQFGEAAA